MTEDDIVRYSRHILLPRVGGTGQERLLAATVAIDLASGAGAATCAAFLAAAGVGTVELLDPALAPWTEEDVRGAPILRSQDIGKPRGPSLATRLAQQNPSVCVHVEPTARREALSPTAHSDHEATYQSAAQLALSTMTSIIATREST